MADLYCHSRAFLKKNSIGLSGSAMHQQVPIVMAPLGAYQANHYRPQTKLREGYVFTGVCHSVHRGIMCARGGLHALGNASGACMPPLQPDTMRYGQSMSGRYVPYWNAFLFKFYPANARPKKIIPISS